jgi:hypothetical protein
MTFSLGPPPGRVPDLRIISLGAGVQSSTMALMAARGDIPGPRPDAAVFADTGWEPKAVYDWLEKLKDWLPFPIHIVSAGNLREDLMNGGSARAGAFVTVPYYLRHLNGKHGIGRRQCTSHYKVEPIRKKERELLGKGPRDRIRPGAVEKWIGISLDEIIRATPSKVAFEFNRHPLLEARMTRNDCVRWLQERQYPVPPKSACLGCPFHTNEAWRSVKSDPAAWADVIEVDRAIRRPVNHSGEQFMHASRKPIDEVDLSTAEDRGQMNLFLNDCEGMCGV